MGDIKFECPACGQHLACDSGYGGRQVPCPACQASVSVPSAVTPPPVPGVMPVMTEPPPVPGRAVASTPAAASTQQTWAPQPAKTSGLAIASLVCSCAGLVFGFLSTIPGLILGFKALRQIKTNPGTGGKGLAIAGLITGGFFTLAWIPLTFILAMGIIGGFRAVRAMKGMPAPVQVSGETLKKEVTTDLTPDGPRPDEPPSDTEPDSAGWTLDLSSATIPEVSATGRVHGVAFKTDRATFEGPTLKLRQGVGFFADREFEILVWDAMADTTKLAGRTIEVLPGDTGQKPSVRVSWMAGGRGVPDSSTASTYAMRLEFGQIQNGRLPGRIYLCVADREKSFVRGKFIASLPQMMMAPPPRPFPQPTAPPNFPVQPPRPRR